MTDLWANRLSEYLDDELTPTERAQLESHLEMCLKCRDELKGLRRILERMKSLEDQPPQADLWPTIGAQISTPGSVPESSRPDPVPEPSPLETAPTGRYRASRRWNFLAVLSPRLVAASIIALAVLTLSVVWLARTWQPVSRPNTEISSNRFLDLAGITAQSIESYQQTVTAWRTLIEERQLPSEVAEPLREHLDYFDQAVLETREALKENPDDAYLREHLSRMLRSQLRFLRRTERLLSSA